MPPESIFSIFIQSLGTGEVLVSILGIISAAAFALLYKQVCVSFVPAHRLRLDFSARCLRMLAFFMAEAEPCAPVR